MKFHFNSQKAIVLKQHRTSLILKIVLIIIAWSINIATPLFAQDTKLIKPSWWVGFAGGSNANLYHGSIQEFNSTINIPVSLGLTRGNGLFAFPVLEYHKPGAKLGFMLYSGYESRQGTFNQELSSKIAYVTIEPSLRLNLFNSPLYVYAGPRFAINTDKRFLYNDVLFTMDNMKPIIFSMQIGGGYDFTVTPGNKKNQAIISPFFAFHPYFGQNPRSIEGWNITTIRGGIAFKFGRGTRMPVPDHVEIPTVIPDKSEVTILPIEKQSGIENIELIGRVFYDLKAKEIDYSAKSTQNRPSEGIVTENKDELPALENNILNEIGNYLKRYPKEQLTLIGTSNQDKTDGKEMAESVSTYLKDVYGISNSSINTTGKKVKVGHEVYSGNKDELLLLEYGSRKVLVKSQNRALMLEISNLYPGPKTKRVFVINEPVPDNYLAFSTENAQEPLSSWSLKLTDEKGVVQNFGPFSKDFVKIPTRLVLGDKAEAYFNILVSGQSKNLITINKDTTIHIARWTPPQLEKNYRFSVTYAFNNPKAIRTFEKYLVSAVLPNIPVNGRVVIHGHSENIESTDYYLKTSLTRENDVKRILEDALAKLRRTDVNFEMHGFGEDVNISVFERVPEEKKLVWRTVIIDIVNSEE